MLVAKPSFCSSTTVQARPAERLFKNSSRVPRTIVSGRAR